MNKKEYKCGQCGKILIRRHLPSRWGIRTTKTNNKVGLDDVEHPHKPSLKKTSSFLSFL